MFGCWVCGAAATAWSVWDTYRAYRRGGWRSALVEGTSFVPAFGRTGARTYTWWARRGISRAYKRHLRSYVKNHYRRHLARSYAWYHHSRWLDVSVNYYDTIRYAKAF